jgi:hypothetical protein
MTIEQGPKLYGSSFMKGACGEKEVSGFKDRKTFSPDPIFFFQN